MAELLTPDVLSITVAQVEGEYLVTVRHRISEDGLEYAHFAFRVPRRSYDIRTLEHLAHERLRKWAAQVATTPPAAPES